MKNLQKRLLVVAIILCMCLTTSVQTFAYTISYSSPYNYWTTRYSSSRYSTTSYFNNPSASSYDPNTVSIIVINPSVPTTTPQSEPIANPAPTPEPASAPPAPAVTPTPAPAVTPVPTPTPAPSPVVTPTQPALKVTVVKIGKDTVYETPMYVFDTGKAGKTVWINGGTHGNETSGYQAALKFLDQVKNGQITIKTGKLIILPQANIQATTAHKRFAPDGVNLNLAFPKAETSPAPTYPLAKAIWAQILKYKPDYFLDLHESIYYHNLDSSNTGQTIIYMPIKDGRTITNSIITELNKNITDSVAKYTALRYPVSGSIARATSECLDTVSFIAEACDNETLTTRVNNHVNTCKYLLKFVGML